MVETTPRPGSSLSRVGGVFFLPGWLPAVGTPDYGGRVEERDNPSTGMSVTHVQQWILSVLAFTIIEHFAAGLVVAAIFSDKQDARVGLNVLAGITGVMAV